MATHGNFIAGEWKHPKSARAFDNRNPADTQDLVGFCGQTLCLVEIPRQQRGVGQRVAEPHRVTIGAEPLNGLADESVCLGRVPGAPRRDHTEVPGPRHVPG